MDMDINIYKGGGRLSIDAFFFDSAALIGKTARGRKRQEDQGRPIDSKTIHRQDQQEQQDPSRPSTKTALAGTTRRTIATNNPQASTTTTAERTNERTNPSSPLTHTLGRYLHPIPSHNPIHPSYQLLLYFSTPLDA